MPRPIQELFPAAKMMLVTSRRYLPASLPALVLVFSLAGPAAAELVVLVGGDVFKVDDYQVDSNRVRLSLPDGGTVTLALGRVERIVDDEIVPDDAPPLPEAVFELGFVKEITAPDTPYGDLFYTVGERHSLNPVLLAAMAQAESNFDPGALSRKGARGLLQLMPATAERFGVSPNDLWIPERNAEAAARYLKWLIGNFDGELSKVLAAYNAGEGTVEKYGGVPPYRETRNYVSRIYETLGL